MNARDVIASQVSQNSDCESLLQEGTVPSSETTCGPKNPCNICKGDADKILAALAAAGFKVLSREPTEEMLKAYYDALHGSHPTAKMNPAKALVDHHIKANKRWRAMFDAAAPTKGGET